LEKGECLQRVLTLLLQLRRKPEFTPHGTKFTAPGVKVTVPPALNDNYFHHFYSSDSASPQT
jgi:hypothetical protein